MSITYRQGTSEDLVKFTTLAVKAWACLKPNLTDENWLKLRDTVSSEKTYTDLLSKSHCIVAENTYNEMVGMAFLVRRGNPTEIYDKDWSYIRMVSVDPDFEGQGIARRLTSTCIEVARESQDQTIALHTSELMDAARHIYESLGFTVLKEINPRLGKRFWLYTLHLDRE